MSLGFKDGYQTLTTFALDTSFQFWEKSAKPVGYSGGGAIDTTTQHNNNVRTKSPKALLDVTDGSMSGSWSSASYQAVVAMMLKNQLITTTFPDSSTVSYWGWIESFEPDDMTEGEHPNASIVIIASNIDDAGDEVMPVHFV